MTTREQLIEAMARAALAHLEKDDEIYVGGDEKLQNVTIDGRVDFIALVQSTLTAIEAAGLCIVPRDATGAMEREGWEVEELATPNRVYRAMIEAGRL